MLMAFSENQIAASLIGRHPALCVERGRNGAQQVLKLLHNVAAEATK